MASPPTQVSSTVPLIGVDPSDELQVRKTLANVVRRHRITLIQQDDLDTDGNVSVRVLVQPDDHDDVSYNTALAKLDTIVHELRNPTLRERAEAEWVEELRKVSGGDAAGAPEPRHIEVDGNDPDARP